MLDITKIVNTKLTELEESQTIEALISKGIESTVTRAVKDTLDGYDFRNRISKELNEALNKLDFTTYNGFVVDTIKTMIEGTIREDLRDRAEKQIAGMLVCDRKEIKLSEIFESYKKDVCASEYEGDKYRRERFYASMEESPHGWFNIKLNPEEPSCRGYRDDVEIAFTVHVRSTGEGWISTVSLDGVSLDKKLKLGHLSDTELMLVQAVYNSVDIIVDVEGEWDIDNSYDVDI